MVGHVAVQTPRVRRRWFQFSLRTLLLLVLLASVVLSAFAMRRERVKRQREAYAILQEYPGRVWYDYECDRSSPKFGKPPGPAWARRWLGDDFFANIEHVCLAADGLTDRELAHIADLRDLKFLNLGGASITDEGLRQLRSLHRLEYLSLHHVPIRDAGLEHLESMNSLTSLRLSRTSITDRGLVHLEKLPGLEELILDGTNITDVAVEHLVTMAHLKKISICDTAITADGVTAFRQCMPQCTIRCDPGTEELLRFRRQKAGD